MADTGPLHLVSAFATTSRLVLGQEAVADKSGETAAIPILLERLAAGGGLKGALVSIDAIATNAVIAGAIRQAGADYLLAVKANQPGLREEIERYFVDAPAAAIETAVDNDKGHGRVEQRSVSVSREVDWLQGERRFPGEWRLPAVTTLVRVCARTGFADRCRVETRYDVSSAALSAKHAADAVRGHWAIENSLHWVLDVVFADGQARVRKGHGAQNMAAVRHFAINLVRAPQLKKRIKRRRKIAGWNPQFLADILNHPVR
jgi:predicted transposase YbfD/YdcC